MLERLKEKVSGTVIIKIQKTYRRNGADIKANKEVFLLGKQIPPDPRYDGPCKTHVHSGTTCYAKTPKSVINKKGYTNFVEVEVDEKCVPDWGETVAIFFKPKLEGGDLV